MKITHKLTIFDVMSITLIQRNAMVSILLYCGVFDFVFAAVTWLIRVCVQDRELAQAELDGESHSRLHQLYIYYTEVSIWASEVITLKSCFVLSVVNYYRV